MDNNIRRLRLEHGLSQQELGKKLNVSKGTVYTWESGYREPSVQAVQKLCDFFSVTRAELYMTETELAEKAAPAAEKMPKADILRFLIENERLCLWQALLSASDNPETLLFAAAEELVNHSKMEVSHHA